MKKMFDFRNLTPEFSLSGFDGIDGYSSRIFWFRYEDNYGEHVSVFVSYDTAKEKYIEMEKQQDVYLMCTDIEDGILNISF